MRFFIFMILLAFPAWTQEHAYIAKMDRQEYEQWLTVNPPLDRLAIVGGTFYFLVDPNVVDLPVTAIPQKHLRGNKSDINGAYHTFAEAEAKLQNLAADYPQLAQLQVFGKSVEGRNLYAIEIGNGDENSPTLVLIGCHHAREWISVEVPLLLAEHLLTQYDKDTEIRELVDNSRFLIVPVLNPDGLEFSLREYRYWRKNRRYLGNFQWGVDPNRNYDFQWGLDDEGSSPDPSSQVYRGEAPFSEPETQAMRVYLLANPPTALISYHNYSQTIIYPWGYTEEPAANAAEMEALAAGMSAQMEVNGRVYSYGQSSTSLYFTNGEFTDWVYATFQAPAFTVELPPEFLSQGGFFTTSEDIQPIFEENLAGVLYWANYFQPAPPSNLRESSQRQLKERHINNRRGVNRLRP